MSDDDTTTTTEAKITIPMSERAPLRVSKSKWPLIASAIDYDGQHESQSHRTWQLRVRQHEDGRTVVYGSHGTAFAGELGRTGGLLLVAGCSSEEIVRAIRRVAGMIERDALAQACIDDLPGEEIDE